MIGEDPLEKVTAGLLLVAEEASAEVRERIRADVFGHFLAVGISNGEIVDISVFELLIRLAANVFEDQKAG